MTVYPAKWFDVVSVKRGTLSVEMVVRRTISGKTCEAVVQWMPFRGWRYATGERVDAFDSGDMDAALEGFEARGRAAKSAQAWKPVEGVQRSPPPPKPRK